MVHNIGKRTAGTGTTVSFERAGRPAHKKKRRRMRFFCRLDELPREARIGHNPVSRLKTGGKGIHSTGGEPQRPDQVGNLFIGGVQRLTKDNGAHHPMVCGFEVPEEKTTTPFFATQKTHKRPGSERCKVSTSPFTARACLVSIAVFF